MTTPLVRTAPSPTGYLHIGNVRSIMFNWLFARRHGGRFLLRYDDTDLARSKPEFAEAIAEDLAWLGVVPDFVIKQSDRLALYDAAPPACARPGGSIPATRPPTSSTVAASASSRAACRRSMTAPR
jgi:glutamyl-tRNA synthetase